MKTIPIRSLINELSVNFPSTSYLSYSYNKQRQSIALQYAKQLQLTESTNRRIMCFSDHQNRQFLSIFIPIIQNPQNNLQEPMIQDSQIKNLPFSKQKSMFLKMLAFLGIASTIEYFLMYGLFIATYKLIDEIAPVLFPICLIALISLLKIGSDRKYKKSVHPLIIYIFSIYLIPQTLLAFSRLFNHTKPPNEDGFYITVADLVFMGLAVLIGFNGFSTLFTLVYLLIESKKISVIPIIAILSGCSVILIVLFWPFFIDCGGTIVYGILLINSLDQIQSGRFQLNDNDVLFNTNALLYGILVPFNQSE